jgi:putative ATPase
VLNALELAVETTPANEEGLIEIDLAVAEESIQRRAVLYDKEGDIHYDTISAFIKSLRGSDPDAALYWMAKMIYAGEDPRFIFRRMTIFAGEDIGMADPQAITVVTSCWNAFERIGMPEGRFPLAQAAIYLSTAPKSNSAFAFFDALETVEKERETEVPNHLRDASRDSEGFGHGQGYLYPHAYRDHWVAQQYLPDALQGKVFYQPGDLGHEQKIQREVSRRRESQLAAMVEGGIEAPPEVLTTSPKNRARDAWLQRAISNAGRNLSYQRERLFSMAKVQRHHMLLDLNAGSGLLTWEAVRQAPEGGVYSLVADPTQGDALRQLAQRFAEPERPVILIGELEELDYLLQLRGEADLKFDRIMGRNLFTRRSSALVDLIAQLKERLLRGGRFSFAQIIPRHTQRLYKLVDWSGDDELEDKVVLAEEQIYGDATDPLVNWDENDLVAGLQSAGMKNVKMKLDTVSEQRFITGEQLDRWFRPDSAAPKRAGYSQRLLDGGLQSEEIQRTKALFRRSLQEKQVRWQVITAFIKADANIS